MYVSSDEFRTHPLFIAYDKAREDLIQWGAKEPEPQGTVSQPIIPHQRAPLAGDNCTAQKTQDKSTVLPTFQDILA